MQYPSLDLKATGARIRALRMQKHLRVEDISLFMGFDSPVAVYKWQRGDSLPTVDNLYALSKLLDTPIENILVPYMKEDESLPSVILGIEVTRVEIVCVLGI
jgi:transcriptional regulator with XRE-family HTH domain